MIQYEVMERFDLKKEEMKHLENAFKSSPELFKKTNYIEDDSFLTKFGIHIPGKHNCPLGFLKLYPSDFIVEEISTSGKISTINYPEEAILFPKKDPTNPNHRAIFATLVKCGITTNEAVDEMVKKIGCTPKDIRYAGLKDKNAITSQAISFHNVPIEKIQEISSTHYFLKDIYFDKGSIEKGSLSGNRFTLFIRTPEKVDQHAFKIQEGLVTHTGFYNFYYLQRFGAPRFMNFQWGFDILRGKYKETIMSFLTTTSSRELEYFQHIRKEIASKLPDWEAIYPLIEKYPLIFFLEQKIVSHLRQKPEDYLGALQAIPDQVMLWTYGFSSLLFNQTLSAYIKNGVDMPQEIPLLLSDKKEDVDFYSSMLKSIKYYPPVFKNVYPFPHIQFKRRMVPTIEKIGIEKITFVDDGVALRFSLKKGEYATTFLSHLFNIVSGSVPQNVSTKEIDSPALLMDHSISSTLSRFKEINMPKKEFSFGTEVSI